MTRLRWLFVPLLSGGLFLGACKKEPAPRFAGGPAPGTSPPTSYPQPAPTPAPSPAPAPSPTASAPSPAPQPTGAQPSGPQPAAGWPCASDMDIQCAFGRCVGGRCGGCRGAGDCKPGSSCLGTPLGMSCFPTGSPAPSPSPAPTPTPAPPATTAPPSTPPAPDAFAQARELCLKRTNEYRATKSLPLVTRKLDAEPCGDAEAQADSANKAPHGSFGKCGELAQNECPGWKGKPETVVDACLKAMFAEGPGQGPAHGHYNNIMGAYAQISCSVFVASDGGVWVVQNFFK